MSGYVVPAAYFRLSNRAPSRRRVVQVHARSALIQVPRKYRFPT